MLSKAEIKRRRQQSARDKKRHREEQEEQERRRRQSLRDRARHRSEQTTSLIQSPWASISFQRHVEPPPAATSSITRSPAIVSEQLESAIGDLDITENGAMDFRDQFGRKASQMFNQHKHADVSIKIGDTKVPAHQFVICLQSRYFEDALNGAFVEGSTKTLECPPQKEHAYLRVLRYLYTGDYEEEPTSLIADQDDPELLKDPRVYFLADSFFLDDLKTLAREKFVRKLDELWVSEGFTGCIAEIYANTVPETCSGLRSAVVDISVDHIDQLLSRTTFVALIDEGGDFAVELLRALAAKQKGGKRRSSYD